MISSIAGSFWAGGKYRSATAILSADAIGNVKWRRRSSLAQ
jgi:hypothetical protein